MCRILLPSTFNGSELDLPHRPDRKETRWLLILASRCRVLGNFSRGLCPRRQCHGQDNTRASLQNSKRNKASRHPRRKRAILTTTPTIGTAGTATAELDQNNQNLPLRYRGHSPISCSHGRPRRLHFAQNGGLVQVERSWPSCVQRVQGGV